MCNCVTITTNIDEQRYLRSIYILLLLYWLHKKSVTTKK